MSNHAHQPRTGLDSAAAKQCRETLAVIYCRVSDPHQAGEDKVSLHEQEREGRDYCQRKAYGVLRVYVDPGRKGDVLERPELLRLLKDMRRGEFDVIVAHKIDRFSRDPEIQAFVKVQGKLHDVRLEFVQTADVKDERERRVMETIYGLKSWLELDDIRSRTQMGRRGRATKGRLMTASFPMYGYLWADPQKGQRTRYTRDPETDWVVERIVREVACGRPVRRIIMDLNQDGIPSPAEVLRRRGQLSDKQIARAHFRWTRYTVARIINTSTYAGEHVLYRSQTTYVARPDPHTGESRQVRVTRERQPGEEGYKVIAVEAIVDKAVLTAAQARLQQNRVDASRSKQEPTDALLRAGHVICGHCQTPMIVARRHDHPQQTRYVCRLRHTMAFVTGVKCPVKYNSMRVDVLDPLVWAEVTALCTRPEVLVAMLSRSDVALAGQREDTLAALTTVETVLEEAHDRLTGLIEQSALSGLPEAVRDALAFKMEEQATIITKMGARKLAIVEQQATQRMEEERVKEVVDWIRTVGESLESFSYEQKRRLLYALGVRAIVTRGEAMESRDISSSRTLRG